MKKILLPLLILAAMLNSCTIKTIKKEDIAKHTSVKTVDVNNFNQLKLFINGNVEFKQDSVCKVVFEAPDFMIDDLVLRAEDNELSIDMKKDAFKDRTKISSFYYAEWKVTVSAPSLEMVALYGVGDFKCKDMMTADSLDIWLGGNGNIEFGFLTAKTINAKVIGNGDIRLKPVNTANVALTITGNGDIDAEFKECGVVSANIIGNGDINLKGSIAKLDTDNKNVSTNKLIIK